MTVAESRSINTVFGGEATFNFYILAFSSNAELWLLPNQNWQNSQQEIARIKQIYPFAGSSTPPEDVSGLIVASNMCILCLIVTSLRHPQRAHANSPSDIQ